MQHPGTRGDISEMSDHMSMLAIVASDDVERLTFAERQYGSSWKKRGGVGAYMMLARKWDRIEQALAPDPDDPGLAAGMARQEFAVPAWDVLEALRVDQRQEGLLDDIRDLRRYLMLVEAEHRAWMATQHAIREGIEVPVTIPEKELVPLYDGGMENRTARIAEDSETEAMRRHMESHGVFQHRPVVERLPLLVLGADQRRNTTISKSGTGNQFGYNEMVELGLITDGGRSPLMLDAGDYDKMLGVQINHGRLLGIPYQSIYERNNRTGMFVMRELYADEYGERIARAEH